MLPSTRALLTGLLRGDRASLSRSITLIESLLPAHRHEADLLLGALLREPPPPASAEHAPSPLLPPAAAASASQPPPLRTLRLGVAGPPGAGKSSLIEALGLALAQAHPGARLAVLAIDPSSSRTGGSILGDKTRMGGLAVHPRVYVRPTPARGALGGVARATHEVVSLCEGAGYSTTVVETVGLGQSETAVEGVVDCTLLVLPPSAGDELQGLKKGIVECADVIVVNKADGATADVARASAAEYRSALALAQGRHNGRGGAGEVWAPRVLAASAASGEGVAGVWGAVREYCAALGHARLGAQRRTQGEAWMWGDFEVGALAAARARVAALGRAQAQLLAHGRTTPRAAALELLRALGLQEEGGR